MEAESRTAEKLTAENGQQERSTIQLVRDIATDTSTLVRKEIELARQEVTEALKARLLGGAALAVGGAMAVFGLIYLGIAAGSALSIVLPRWLAWLIVGGAFLVVAGGAALFGLAKMKKPPIAPAETKRTVKEDVKWAKAQLKR
jgi:Putative Actinobacterial Holin-X, holin superfamily III